MNHVVFVEHATVTRQDGPALVTAARIPYTMMNAHDEIASTDGV